MISLNTMNPENIAEVGDYRTLDVAAIGGKLLNGRSSGREFLREYVEPELEAVKTGGVLYVDLRGVEILDYSFSDAAFGAAVENTAHGDYGDRSLVLLDVERDQLENIEMSLGARDQNVFRVEEVGGEPHLLGRLEEHLVETVEIIRASGAITTADLAGKLGVNHTACNNRTTNLHKRGLIRRRKETGGRRYVYEVIV